MISKNCSNPTVMKPSRSVSKLTISTNVWGRGVPFKYLCQSFDGDHTLHEHIELNLTIT